jgi:hypothetical protein
MLSGVRIRNQEQRILGRTVVAVDCHQQLVKPLAGADIDAS